MSRDYRNPRFSYRHTLRDLGATGVVASGWTNEEVFWDDQARVFGAGSTAAAFNVLDYDRGAGVGSGVELNRVIVPKGHNLRKNKAAYCLFHESAVFGSATHRDLVDGQAESYLHPSSHHAVWDFDSSASATLGYDAGLRFGCAPTGASPALEALIGELWWTKVEQPTTGIVQSFAEPRVPNSIRRETQGGQAYVIEKGEDRRLFTLEHRGLSGDDLRLYEELLRYTHEGRRPFWYEHPASGGAEHSVGDTTSTSLWTTTGAATLALDAGELEMTAGAAASAAVELDAADWPAGTPTDWRDHIFSIDLAIDENTSTWADASSSAISLVVSSGVANKSSTYFLAAPLAGSLVIGQNLRCEVDLDLDVDAVGSIFQADLTNISQWHITCDFLNSANQCKFSNPRIIRKDSRPVLVEIASAVRKPQDSEVPRSGPTFTVAFDMVEVLT